MLHRCTNPVIAAVWPLLAKLDTPARAVEHSAEVKEVAAAAGRSERAAGVLAAAKWFVAHPESLESWETMTNAPHVGPGAAVVAALVDPTCGPNPVVVSSTTLRVAARVLGSDVDQRRSRSDGRLAIARLIGGPAAGRADESRIAMAAMMELAASMCGPSDTECASCPLNGVCSHHDDRLSGHHTGA